MKTRPGAIKKTWKPSWNHEKQNWNLENHENPLWTMKTNLEPWKTLNLEKPGTIKNQPGNLKTQKKSPGTVKNHSGTLTNHKNWPGKWKTNLNPWKPIKADLEPKQIWNHQNQPGIVQDGYGWFRWLQETPRRKWSFFVTDRHFIIIYISSSSSC